MILWNNWIFEMIEASSIADCIDRIDYPSILPVDAVQSILVLMNFYARWK